MAARTHHGVDVAHRREIVRERILACKELWTAEEAEYHGTYVDFEPSWAWPKPVQRPHPPIVIGAAATPVHVAHIVEYADGWMPLPGRFPVADGWARILAAAEQAGRDPATWQLGVFGADPSPANLDTLRDLGATWVTLNVPPMDREAAMRQLDAYAPLIETYHHP